MGIRDSSFGAFYVEKPQPPSFHRIHIETTDQPVSITFPKGTKIETTDGNKIVIFHSSEGVNENGVRYTYTRGIEHDAGEAKAAARAETVPAVATVPAQATVAAEKHALSMRNWNNSRAHI